MTVLDNRAQEIFNFIVHSFLDSGIPTSSRAISKQISTKVSPATIRNTMSDLQDMGLIYAPHTSAGRLPTNDGLRLYINAYMSRGELDARERAAIEEKCANIGRSPKDVYEQTSRILSGMSSSVGMVVVPKKESAIRQIEFLELEPHQALAIIVLEDGMVENRLIDVPEGLSAGSLQMAANFLRSRVYGKTIPEVQQVIQDNIAFAQKELDDLTAKVVEAGMTIQSSAGSDLLVVQGAANLIPEGATEEDIEDIQRLFNLLEEQETATRLLQEAMNGDGVQIFVGSDNKVFNSRRLSMVLSPALDENNNIVGATGVIGPRRLNYRRVVPVVDYTSQLMSRLISKKNGPS